MFVKNKKVELKEKKKMEEKIENIYVGCNKDTAAVKMGFARHNPETGVFEKVNLRFDSAESLFKLYNKAV